MKIQGHCEICSNEIEIERCCDGWGCGCGGGPIDPPVCSDECFNKLLVKRQAERIESESEQAERESHYNDPDNLEGLPF